MIFFLEAGNRDESTVETKTRRRNNARNGGVTAVQLVQSFVRFTVVEIYLLFVELFVVAAQGKRIRGVETLRRVVRCCPEASVWTEEGFATLQKRRVVVGSNECSRSGIPHIGRQIFQKHMTRDQEASVGAETYGASSPILFAGHGRYRFDGLNDLFGRCDIPLLKGGPGFGIDRLNERRLLVARHLVRCSSS